jgi:hypothetical protein
MFVNILKECECRLVFWYDQHWVDRWKDDDWVKKERQEMLKAGQRIEAVAVRPSATHDDRCCIDVTFMGDMTNCYMDVPCDYIEIVEAGTERKSPHGPRRTRN